MRHKLNRVARSRNRKDGLRGFFWPRTKCADDAEARAYAGRIGDACRSTD